MTKPLHILVTGTSRGIGDSILTALEGERAIGHSTGGGGGGRIAADLADPEAANRLWRDALAALDGRIDVLINNAGVFEGVDVAAPDADWAAAWERTLRINLRASADLCRLAVLHGGFGWISGGRIGEMVGRDEWQRGFSAAKILLLP